VEAEDCAGKADGITYGNTGARPRALCDRFSATGWTPANRIHIRVTATELHS